MSGPATADPPGAYSEAPLQGLALLLWATGPDRPDQAATPFALALAARALEWPVELYFSAGSVRLLVPGVAEALHPSAQHGRSVADWLCEAHAAGCRFFTCSDALAAQGLRREALRPEGRDSGGLLPYTLRAADARWRCLVF